MPNKTNKRLKKKPSIEAAEESRRTHGTPQKNKKTNKQQQLKESETIKVGGRGRLTSASNVLVLVPSGRWWLPKAQNPLSLRLAKVGVCRQEPQQLVPIPKDILPPNGAKILGPSPYPPVLLAPLHPVHRAKPGDDAVELVHEHAEREEHRGGGDDQHRSDEVRREGAVVVAVLPRDALYEVVQHEADSVGRHRQGVE